MAFLVFVSGVLFLVMRKPLPHFDIYTHEIVNETHNDKAIEDQLSQNGIINNKNNNNNDEVNAMELQNNNKPTAETNYKEDMKSVIRMTLSKRFRLMIPLCFWTGISIAYYSGILVIALVDTLPDESPNVQY